MTMRSSVLLVVVGTMLSACGGGGSGNSAETCVSGISGLCSMLGTTPPSQAAPGAPSQGQVATPTVTLALMNASGSPSNSLTGATPLTVKATVLDANNKPVPNAVVSFATNNALAVFSPTSGTALTDTNGVASISMRAANPTAAGAGTVTASSTVGSTTVLGKTSYAVSATTLSFGTLSASPASIQAYGSTVLSVDVMAGTGKFTDQPVNVTFSSACVTAGKATLSNTVLSNNGTAQTVFRDKGCANNDIVTVSADGIAKPATTALAIAPPAAASLQFVQAVPSDKSIVIKGEGGIGRTETATLTFKIVDTSGNPLSGRQVSFARIPETADIVINKASDTSDANGNVMTTVNSGATATVFRVRATLQGTGNDGTNISTTSDSVVVTTGFPQLSSLTLIPGIFNIEGWGMLGATSARTTNVSVLLADRFSNPVPDGTPVVFQTSIGAIGSSDRGGCNTVNGTCSVEFRVQNPLVATGLPMTPCNTYDPSNIGAIPIPIPDSTRAGVATICASTADGSKRLVGRTLIFVSGSQAANTTMNSAPVSFSAPNDLGSLRADETKVFQLQINDINKNPMPAGTRVELTSVLNAVSAAVVPATVPSIAPHTADGKDDPTGNAPGVPQGSIHTFSVGSPNPTECKGPVQASFNVAITTPGGIVTTIPFKISFTCP